MQEFEKIYAGYFSDVYRCVLSLSQNESISEEITQEIFFKALRHIDRFNGNCKLYVWLCQIAKNTYFSYYKNEKRCCSDSDVDPVDSTTDLEKTFLDNDTAKRLHYLLHHLREPYKEVFTLRVFGDLPFAQIGELFGKSDSWARLVFYRAKKELQEGIK